ncbi:MAG: alpha/beta hydrolase fold domain-containing protein [Rubrivivax sp.]|nr:alpha/beta hydrolase fold domain-containing protein [Rubrivivax sp.]
MTHHPSAPALLPELAAVVAGLPTPPTTPAELATTRERLAALVRLRQAEAPASPTIELSERHAPGMPGDPDVRVLVYRPRGTTAPCPALLWIHGGGYVAGTPEFDDAQVRRIVEAVGCVVVSVDYRLAPEHPHPAPLHDCHAALQWLQAQADDLGVDRGRLAVAGQSAGGGLCAALALLVRDRGEIRLCLQAPLQAMLDDRTGSGDGPLPAADGWVLTAASNRYKWQALLGHPPGRAGAAPYAVPARAATLAGLPPTFLSIGALDLFTEENVAYAQRLVADGVATELHVWPGACHAFDLLAPQHAVSKASEQAFHDALRRAFGATEIVAAPTVANADLAQRLRSNTPGIPDRDIARFAGSLGAPQPYAPGPEARPRADVHTGEVLQRRHESRGIYPGVARDYWVYVPRQLEAARDANLLVFQDGARYLGPECSAALVLDTLIADGAIPPTVAVFVQPGDRGPGLPIYGGTDNRSVEYDSTGDAYVRFLMDELLPEALHGLNVSAQADRRAICGLSSGGHCALNAAWERPDVFGRVISHCGSFVDIRGGHTLASRVRRSGDARAERLRVFLQTGEHDLDIVFGHWVQANRDMAAALAYRGIEHRLVIGRGGHSLAHGGAIFPDTLRWLWRAPQDAPPAGGATGAPA